MATLRVDHRERYPNKLWLSCGGALLGALQFGYQAGVLNTALPYVTADLQYGNEAVLSSAVVAGAAFGAIVAGRIADAIGPKRAQLLNSIPFVLGALLSALSPGCHVGFLAGRLLSGFGAGAASLYTPRYIAEISPPCLRGRLGSQNQVFINIGILLAYCCGIPFERGFTSFTIGTVQLAWWRVMLAAGVVPALLQVVLLAMCPESPVWLESIGEREQADVSCIKLWGPYAIVPDMESEDTNLLLADEEGDGASHQEGWGALFKRQYRWMVLLALGLPLLQQASGINTVIYYSSMVFTRAGLQSPVLGSILMALVNLAFTLLAASLMDRMGRKPLLIVSFAGMAACLIGVAVVIYVPTSLRVQGILTVLFILAYVLCFALGAGPIPWVVISEVLPPRIKGTVASLATALCWAGNLVVTLSFEPLLGALGIGGSYLLYAALNLGALWFVTALMVETKCKTLAEIEELLLLPEEEAVASSRQQEAEQQAPLLLNAAQYDANGAIEGTGGRPSALWPSANGLARRGMPPSYQQGEHNGLV